MPKANAVIQVGLLRGIFGQAILLVMLPGSM